MSALQPMALLWLLLAVPAILLLYLLKPKRREHLISSVLLWDRLLKDTQARTPFQKLRRSLLLLLQLLLVVLLAMALSRPFVRVHALGGQSMAIVIDESASMRSTDVPESRFEEARRVARRMIDGMGQSDRAVLILAGARAHAACPLTGDKNALCRALDEIRPADTETRMREAVLLAASLLAGQPDARIYLLTDGGFEMEEGEGAQAGLPLGEAQLHFVRIGQKGDNVGVTALDVRQTLADDGGYQAFARVRNFSDQARRFTLEFYRDDRLLDAREMTLGPGKAHAEVFALSRDAATGVLRARIDAADDLAVDNSAAVVLQPRKRVEVLLVSRGNLFLEKALSVDPRVALSKIAPGPDAAVAAPRYDLVILDGKSPAGLPARGRYLFIGGAGEHAPVTITGETRNPTFLDWDRRHPVTRFLDFSSVQVARALAAKPLPWGQTLAECEAGALIAAGEKDGLRSLFLAFDLTESDLPLRVAFPILLSNAVEWLMGSEEAASSHRARMGAVVPVEVPEDAREVQVVLPDGSRRSLRVEGSPLLFAETAQTGIYRVEGKSQGKPFRTQFAVSLLSEAESDIRPRDRIAIGRTSVSAVDARSQKAPREIWHGVAFLALCLMAFEWYAYHRRL